ncbi:MAG: phosphatidate cytidylyltransferase [Firmicutes bacterium]|nr:phosphatidate cytidylyltransferase [Bacillota bacterium]MDH7494941.1 phosphatidate cytidylyltransferase [Bacillota bacterium]
MRDRVVSALVAAPVTLAVVAVGGPYLAVVVACVGVGAVLEFYSLAKGAGLRPTPIIGVLGVVSFAVSGYAGSSSAVGAILASMTLVSLVFQTLKLGRESAIANPAVTVFGGAYVGWTICLLQLLRGLGGKDAGLGHVVTLLVTVWANDIGAYFLGTALGRHKLMAEVSPKKSVEGALAGLVAGLCVGVGARLVGAALGWWPGIPLAHAVAASLAIGVAGQAGDLAESAMKRNANVKDSGMFLPGHGGVLDRVDSLLFAVPVAYYYAILFLA